MQAAVGAEAERQAGIPGSLGSRGCLGWDKPGMPGGETGQAA
jgi:hypothetical protein